MKKLFFYITFVLFANMLSGQKAEQMKWMIGTWKINAGSSIIIEQWKWKNDSTLSGKSFFIKNGIDSIPQESVELAFRNNNWYYISTVKGQNNDQPVPFRVIFLKGTEFISENPAHDFPQRISYRRIMDKLFASIEGTNKGKYNKQNFDFSIE